MGTKEEKILFYWEQCYGDIQPHSKTLFSSVDKKKHNNNTFESGQKYPIKIKKSCLSAKKTPWSEIALFQSTNTTNDRQERRQRKRRRPPIRRRRIFPQQGSQQEQQQEVQQEEQQMKHTPSPKYKNNNNGADENDNNDNV